MPDIAGETPGLAAAGGLTPPGVAARMASLAARPAAAPAARLGRHAAHRLAYGSDFEDVEPGSQPVDRVPLITVRGRVARPDEAARLQLAYRTLQSRFARHTRTGRRLSMAGDAAFPDASGALCTFVTGLVTDAAAGPDGALGRIMLTAPTVSRLPGVLDGPAADSHLWLRCADLDPAGDHAPADDPDARLHAGLEGRGAIHMGETLCVAARLSGYTDSRGRRRLGVAEWTPVACALLYRRAGADGGLRLGHAPRHVVSALELMAFDGTAVAWRDPLALMAEADGLAARWPSCADGMELMREV